MKQLAVIGAGGKMGYRVSANLKDSPYKVSHVEVSEAGRERLKELNITCVDADTALADADFVILTIPDNMIEKVTKQLVDKFKKGATLIALDAAAPFAGHLPDREDLTIFVAHPCHPPIFNDETDLEAKRDYFGGIKAKQAIVCALLRGDESNYAVAEDVAKRMYAPVMRSHRATVDQMAILEPALRHAQAGTVTGASARNWQSYGAGAQLPDGFAEWKRNLLTDPQTSGGLLVCCTREATRSVIEVFRQGGFHTATRIGQLIAGDPLIEVA